ncbi:MAG: hypothetical protein JJV97_05365 [SAR324 cluster bacterium]|nr:hypothetical protein [SAR324 cluster bacterium]
MHALSVVRVLRKTSLIGLFLLFYSSLWAEQIILDDLEQLKFADYLLEIKDYDRAILEYQRLKYFFPKSSLVKTAIIRTGYTYYLKGPSLSGMSYLKRQIATISDVGLIANLNYQLSIFELDYNDNAPFILREDYIKQGLARLETIKRLNGKATNFNDIYHEWQTREITGQKSPFLAGIMSAIVPGSGSAYSGFWQEGFYSLLLVGMFFNAHQEANTSNDRGYRNLSPLLALLTVSFYGGSIYTAVNSAYFFNSDLEVNHIIKLRDKYNLWLN